MILFKSCTCLKECLIFNLASNHYQFQGLHSLRLHCRIGKGIPIINLRRLSDRLRFIMGILIPVRLFKWMEAQMNWAMGLLLDTQNYWLRMRRECRERFPRHQLQRKPLVSDPGMHHGTCVTHVSWCVSGSLTSGGGENVPGIPGACATRNFAYLVRGSWWWLLSFVHFEAAQSRSTCIGLMYGLLFWTTGSHIKLMIHLRDYICHQHPFEWQRWVIKQDSHGCTWWLIACSVAPLYFPATVYSCCTFGNRS